MSLGPNVNKIASTVPEECSVDQAIYIVRHGSRYPDPGAYQEWEDLHNAVCSQLWIYLFLNNDTVSFSSNPPSIALPGR
ncbi:unnamed protein product [Aspergillus oryzae]|uniref:3-phytase n=1 Tax=Aspergillus oryzae var. brunneus TaxID=332754 RepID=A0ABQ6LF66_ASPOZ|nr:unnamed protein product [Aspergillus oryzae]GMF83660.1 unnamed protein product [Aspergillus oryzae]GMG53469.1 unnamed protein product [Aspergillus oryzae var. brunneus]